MSHLDADFAGFVFLFVILIAHWIVHSHLLLTHTHTHTHQEILT